MSNSWGLAQFGSIRHRPQIIGAALGVVLIADVVLAATSGGSTAAAAIHHSDVKALTAKYAAGLARVEREVATATNPLQQVLDATIKPGVGTTLAAQDAIIHGDTAAELRTAKRELKGLKPPSSLATDYTSMVAGLGQISEAVSQYRQDTGRDESTLQLFTGGPDELLTDGEDKWDGATRKTYSLLGKSRPTALDRATISHLPPSRTSWIYGADRACFASNQSYQGFTKIKPGSVTPAFVEHLFGVSAQTFGRLYTALDKQARPKGRDALPVALKSRLPVLDSISRLMDSFKSAVADANEIEVRSVFAQLVLGIGSLNRLGSALRAYGAGYCSGVLDSYRVGFTNGAKAGSSATASA